MSEAQTPVAAAVPTERVLQHSSTIHIMKVDTPETRVYEGKSFIVYSAQVGLLLDDGSLHEVGRLNMPETLYQQAKVGYFRAAFSLQRAAWGKNKGDIISVLCGLLPMPARALPKTA
ncbi:hypothetical protein [Rhodoferax ferrireducens]|uniref:hypothetical protein n=1 Tax=Rhodoferax ferrireducens TaxID=192843 RepID=UPI00130058EF|nr:hypothetical protein [Rhodoferax ferrireducens]